MAFRLPVDSLILTSYSYAHRLDSPHLPLRSPRLTALRSGSATNHKTLTLTASPPRCGPPPSPLDPKPSSSSRPTSNSPAMRSGAASRLFAPLLPGVLFAAGVAAASTAFQGALPPDYGERLRRLRESSEGAEERVREIPYHLIQAVMASEDRRFFYHFGVDPYGIGRAVVRYPNGGGGSTITQQLVKNVFLTSERKISRKFVEGILSLALEKRLSKWEILYSYLNKMYWGHGNYGIESASLFYFGKQPSLLNLGESALLAGILPSPETLNPFTNPEKGKSSQARALRRMVAAGFLDLETALLVVSQPLQLHDNGSGDTKQEHEQYRDKKEGSIKYIWDWKVANITWEATENMKRWAMRIQNNHQFFSLI